MSTTPEVYDSFKASLPLEEPPPPQWYAIHTRAQHEKRIEVHLRQRGISTFLPVERQVHRWSDRRKLVERPLFPCYAFVQIIPSAQTRLAVLRIDGVIGFVGVRGEGTPIPEWEIESVRLLLSRDVPFASYPFLQIGQRVRIRGGALDGVEGLLVARNGHSKLVVSVELIQRSISVSIEGYEIEPL